METKYLRSFLAVVDCKSFSQAESQLFLSKQGLKRQIDVLEQELDTILLERTHRGVSLTAAGELVYEYAKATIKAEDSMLDSLNAHKKEQSSVTILNHPNQRTWLEQFYSLFSLRYPNIKLNFSYIIPDVGHKKSFPEQIYEQLLDDTVDLAIHVMYEGDQLPEELCYIEIIRQTAFCLMTPEHPLAKENMISVEQLYNYKIGFTQRRSDSAFANTLKENCPNHKIYDVSFNNVPDIFSLCYNQGIWITKGFYAKFMPPLVAIPLDLKCGSYSGVLYKKKHTQAVDKFLEILQEINFGLS